MPWPWPPRSRVRSGSSRFVRRRLRRGRSSCAGPTLVLIVIVQGVEKGASSEIRLTIAPLEPKTPVSAASNAGPPPNPAPTPSPAAPTAEPVGPPKEATGTASPVPSSPPIAPPTLPPLVTPAGPQATAKPDGVGSAFDAAAFGAAKSTPLGRREGLPGEPEMVLDSVRQSPAWVWLVFRVEGAASTRVKRVRSDESDISAFAQELHGRDLHVVVQIPKERVTRKTRVTVETTSGGSYRFALNTGTFPDSLKGLFR